MGGSFYAGMGDSLLNDPSWQYGGYNTQHAIVGVEVEGRLKADEHVGLRGALEHRSDPRTNMDGRGANEARITGHIHF